MKHLAIGLCWLKIESLRNLSWIELAIESPVLVVTGANGSGKTSLLEAVYLLARGRSFRGSKAGPLIRRGSAYTRIEGLYRRPGAPPLRICYRRDASGAVHEIQPPPSDPHRTPFPVKLIGENAQWLIEGEPELRRRFLDWNALQLEPRLAEIQRDFQRVLMQRNAALRSGRDQQRPWDPAFVALSESLDDQRRRFYGLWRAEFRKLCAAYPFLKDADLRYDRGWPKDRHLGEVLKGLAEQEQARGYTLAGPSRADCWVETGPGVAGLSRGQAKAVVVLLQLAAERVHQAHGCPPALWLLDDLEAELDGALASRLWADIQSAGGQVIATRVGQEGGLGVFAQGQAVSLVRLGEAQASG